MVRDGRLQLPRELWDLVLDCLHADSRALSACGLVCRAWTGPSRYHLFAHVDLCASSPLKQRSKCDAFNALLVSPHSTIRTSVRQLDFFHTLDDTECTTPIMIPFIEAVPQLGYLHHLRELALSETPFQLLPAFPRLETLRLYNVTAGRKLLRLGKCAPRLKHLLLERVYAVRFVDGSPEQCNATALVDLQRIVIRHSSIAFLPWLAHLTDPSSDAGLALLDIDGFFPLEMASLVAYLDRIPQAPERIRLVLPSVSDDDDALWAPLSDALDAHTRLDIDIPHPHTESPEFQRQEARLRSFFPRLARRELLFISPTTE